MDLKLPSIRIESLLHLAPGFQQQLRAVCTVPTTRPFEQFSLRDLKEFFHLIRKRINFTMNLIKEDINFIRLIVSCK